MGKVRRLSFIRLIPNFLTILRIFLIIPIACLLFGGYLAKLMASVLFLVAGITDFFDGRIARKYNVMSNFGTFLDPLSDKLVIITILIAFLKLDPTIFPYWMVWIIICREFIVTALRISGIGQNKKVKTLFIGKIKTTAQFTTIFLIIILLIIKDYLVNIGMIKQVKGIMGLPFDKIWFNYFGDWAYFITYTPSFLLGISMILSVYSGTKYILKNKKIIVSGYVEHNHENK